MLFSYFHFKYLLTTVYLKLHAKRIKRKVNCHLTKHFYAQIVFLSASIHIRVHVLNPIPMDADVLLEAFILSEFPWRIIRNKQYVYLRRVLDFFSHRFSRLHVECQSQLSSSPC